MDTFKLSFQPNPVKPPSTITKVLDEETGELIRQIPKESVITRRQKSIIDTYV